MDMRELASKSRDAKKRVLFNTILKEEIMAAHAYCRKKKNLCNFSVNTDAVVLDLYRTESSSEFKLIHETHWSKVVLFKKIS